MFAGAVMRGQERLQERGLFGKGKFGDCPLRLLDDYFKGAEYGSGWANSFTIGAPAAIFGLNNGYNILNPYQDITGTHVDAQPTTVALFQIQYGHFS